MAEPNAPLKPSPTQSQSSSSQIFSTTGVTLPSMTVDSLGRRLETRLLRRGVDSVGNKILSAVDVWLDSCAVMVYLFKTWKPPKPVSRSACLIRIDLGFLFLSDLALSSGARVFCELWRHLINELRSVLYRDANGWARKK